MSFNLPNQEDVDFIVDNFRAIVRAYPWTFFFIVFLGLINLWLMIGFLVWAI